MQTIPEHGTQENQERHNSYCKSRALWATQWLLLLKARLLGVLLPKLDPGARRNETTGCEVHIGFYYSRNYKFK